MDQGWSPSDGGVRSEVQDRAIRQYSNDMLQEFTRTSGDSQALLTGDTEVSSQHMVSLIESICDVFYARMHLKPDSRNYHDGEIICIAVNGLEQNSEADTYLKIAVRESILHRFSPATLKFLRNTWCH